MMAVWLCLAFLTGHGTGMLLVAMMVQSRVADDAAEIAGLREQLAVLQCKLEEYTAYTTVR
jgi:hypothetical protein